MTRGEKVIATLLVVLITAVVTVGVVAWRIHTHGHASPPSISVTTTTQTQQQKSCSTTTSGQIDIYCSGAAP